MRKMKYFIATLFFFCCIIMLCFTSSCFQHQKTIRLGYESWAGYQPVRIAAEKKFFEREGIKVKLYFYTSFNDLLRAFIDNKIDVMFSTSNEAFIAANRGTKLKMILMLDYSAGADAIVAKKSIASINDLKGTKISLETGSVSHFLLLKALEKAHIDENAVTLMNVQGDASIKLFKSGDVDVVVSWEPYLTHLIKEGGHIIFSSKEVPNDIVDVMVVRQDFIMKNPAQCYKLVAAYLDTLHWFHQNFQEGLNIIGKTYEGGADAYKEALTGIQLTGFKENAIAFGTPQKPGALYGASNQFKLFLSKQKMITNKIDVSNMIDPRFVWEYEKKHP